MRKYEETMNDLLEIIQLTQLTPLEINENLGTNTLSLFSEKEYIEQVIKDIFGKDRFIFLKKKM